MASMLDNFNANNIELLRKLGYEVTLAANFEREDSNSKERVQSFKHKMQENYRIKQIDFTRKITNAKGNIKSYKQLKKLAEEDFNIVHCHSPICAAMTRIVFRRKRKTGTKIIYTAHGFHFYKGAPIKNWLLFFPVEWICSYWTDVLITINQEDYRFAKHYMKAKKIKYVPGVGTNIEKFQSAVVNRDVKREELGITRDDILIFSVGELNRNKNHEVVIRAIEELKDKKVHYAVAGQGILYDELENLAEKLNIAGQIHLLGYQNQIDQWYKCADLYILPSIREGLNVSLMEAMASGLPVICSEIRGNTDLIVKEKGGLFCRADNQNDFVKAIRKIYKDKELLSKMGEFNKLRSETFSQANVTERMKRIYGSV